MIDSATLLLILFAAVTASLISIKAGISVAIIEILLGILLGNFLGVQGDQHHWLAFLAGLGSVILTFLAGAEINIDVMKRNWKANVSIGVLSFLVPFTISLLLCHFVVGWTWTSSILAGVVLSDTSVAVVYVVLVETGACRTGTGSIILSSCFVTNLSTAIALSLLFTEPSWYLLALVLAMIASIFLLPKLLHYMLARVEGKSGQPEVKLLLFLIVGVGAVAELAGVVAVLPAYVLGIATARVYAQNKDTLSKTRTLALSFLTPFFHINAGLNVSLTAVAGGLGIVLLLFGGKIASKALGVLPVARRLVKKDTAYITLLMSTGLTFGIISAQYGLTKGLIDAQQFSVLATVVILTAIVPTIIAQRWFDPQGGGVNGGH